MQHVICMKMSHAVPQVPTPYPTALFIREKALVVNLESIRMIISADQVRFQLSCHSCCETQSREHLASAATGLSVMQKHTVISIGSTTLQLLLLVKPAMKDCASCEERFAVISQQSAGHVTPINLEHAICLCIKGGALVISDMQCNHAALQEIHFYLTFSDKIVLVVRAGICAECTRAWAEPGGRQVSRT